MRLGSLVVSTTFFSIVLMGCGGGGNSPQENNNGNNGGGGNGGGTQNFTVTATAGNGGSITPATASVASGETTDLTLTADNGFTINTATGCGGTLNGTIFTTDVITANCSVNASFSAITSGLANIIPTTTAKGRIIIDAQVSLDDNGNGWATWVQRLGLTQGANEGVFVSRLEAGLWQTPENYSCGTNTLSSAPLLQIDDLNNAVLAYQCILSNNPPRDILVDRYVDNVGWTGSETISSVVDIGFRQGSIDFDAAGNALYVYSEGSGSSINSDSDLWFNRFDNGVGWQPVARLESNTAGEDTNVSVSADSAGNGIAVWLREEGIGRSESTTIYYSLYADGSGWQAEQQLSTPNVNSISSMHFSANDTGNAIAVYRGAPSNNVYVNRYVAGSGWQGEELLSSNLLFLFDGKIAAHVDDNGDITVIGSRNTSTEGGLEIWRYTTASGWAAEIIAATTNVSANEINLAGDGSGNYIVSWEAQDAWYVATHTPANGWSFEERPIGQENLIVSMNDAGVGLLLWQQSLNTDDYLFRSETITP